MKTKIINLVKSALLGVAVLGLAVGVSAFGNKFADNTWYFTGSTQSEANDESHWTMTSQSQTGCSSQNIDIPCELKTPSHVNSPEDLKEYFETNPELNDSPALITEAAVTRRNN